MIAMKDRTLSRLAELLEYPAGTTLRCRVDRVRRTKVHPTSELQRCDETVARSLDRFSQAIQHLTDEDIDELYTRTFDLNPRCALEIGWHLFGEDYHRGALLVRLRRELARHGIAETAELPDHLTHVLMLLDRMAEDEAAEFAGACVVPAVDRMLQGLEGRDNPYEIILRLAALLLKETFRTPITNESAPMTAV